MRAALLSSGVNAGVNTPTISSPARSSGGAEAQAAQADADADAGSARRDARGTRRPRVLPRGDRVPDLRGSGDALVRPQRGRRGPSGDRHPEEQDALRRARYPAPAGDDAEADPPPSWRSVCGRRASDLPERGRLPDRPSQLPLPRLPARCEEGRGCRGRRRTSCGMVSRL